MFLFEKIDFKLLTPVGKVLAGFVFLLAGILAFVTFPIWLPLYGLYKLGDWMMTDHKEEATPEPVKEDRVTFPQHMANCEWNECLWGDDDCPRMRDYVS